jgi:hypothetical protein
MPFWRRRLREALLTGLVCLAIALFLTVLGGQLSSFGTKLLYSAAIGYSCFVLTVLLRSAAAALIAAQRRRRGLAPHTGGDFGAAFVPALLLGLVAAPFVGVPIADAISGFRSPSLFALDRGDTRLTLALTVIGGLATFFAITVVERLSRLRAEAEAARRSAAEFQLSLLQAQLEPHMLFNTLANLRVLIGLDAAAAQAMLDRLIAFLRAVLSASREASQPLAAEFDRVADYLALMQVRMGPRLAVRIELPPALGALPVPPLILQPLVENAIRHGLEPRREGGRVEVSAAREGARLVLRVRDTGVGPAATPPATSGTGFGVEQVRRRLATLHGSAARFTLEPAPGPEGGALAVIELPVEAAGAVAPAEGVR